VKKLASMAHDIGALFHCDAAQAPEAIDIDVADWDVDMLSMSAHKIYGPKGIGLLYMKNTLQATLPPLIQGGGQQFGMRSGTLATALCVGFAKAVSIAKQDANSTRARLAVLCHRFKKGLQDSAISFSINGTEKERHPGNLNIAFEGINSTTLLEQLQPYICASTGSACNSDMILLSHVLKGIDLTDEQAMSSVRFSLGRFSNEEQVDQAVKTIKATLETLL
jgi:cysteine desulfurase